MRVKGAIFDMDGTLIESLFFWERFWKSVGERCFGDKNFKPNISLEKKLRTSIYPVSLRIIAEEYKIPVEPFVADYMQYLDDFYRYEVWAKTGAKEFLSDLRRQGMAICVASASPTNQLEVALNAVGLRSLVDSLHSCSDVGVGKESPKVFLKAAESMGLSPSEVCVFEDSFLALETAKSAGFHTVGVYDQYSYEQDRLRAASEIYLSKGQTLADLIGQIQK